MTREEMIDNLGTIARSGSKVSLHHVVDWGKSEKGWEGGGGRNCSYVEPSKFLLVG